MILLIDNYDLFTYNLYQYFSEDYEEIKVVRNDQISIEEIEELNPEAIIISPGPGTPEKAGICIEVVRNLYKKLPIFGVCLGHQTIAVALGGKINRAKEIMHGKQSMITHNGTDLFANISNPAEVMRYHSLVVDRSSLPAELEVTATSLDDEEIMAIKHREYPVYGVQFHPESIGTETGQTIIHNFLKELRKELVQ